MNAIQIGSAALDPVSFRPKGGGGGAPMQMNYTLERKDNRWVVKARRDTGANPHGGMPGEQPGAMPQGAFEQLVSKAKELDMDEVRKQIAAQDSQPSPPPAA